MKFGLAISVACFTIGLAATASAQQWLPWSNQPPMEGEVIVVEITSGGYGSLLVGSYSDCKKTYTHLKTTIADMQEEEGATLIRYDRYRISDDSDANGGSIGNDKDFSLVQEVRIKNVSSQGGGGGGT